MSIDYKSIFTEAGKSGIQTAIVAAGVGLLGAVVSNAIESKLKPKETEAEEEATEVTVVEHEEPTTEDN